VVSMETSQFPNVAAPLLSKLVVIIYLPYL